MKRKEQEQEINQLREQLMLTTCRLVACDVTIENLAKIVGTLTRQLAVSIHVLGELGHPKAAALTANIDQVLAGVTDIMELSRKPFTMTDEEIKELMKP